MESYNMWPFVTCLPLTPSIPSDNIPNKCKSCCNHLLLQMALPSLAICTENFVEVKPYYTCRFYIFKIQSSIKETLFSVCRKKSYG